MAVTPNTELRLIKCNLNLDNNNQLTFANKTAQYNYFNSLDHLTITDISYQRKDNYVRFPAHIDSLIEYNYVMYKNSNYSDKWFYAYVLRMEYENDGCTRIYIKTDVFQTWQFDLTYLRSFVEREHVNNDTVGLHTIPEGLETGEYISTSLQPSILPAVNNSYYECCFVVATTMQVTQSYTTGTEKIPNGLYYYGFTSVTGVRQFIQIQAQEGRAETVQAVFVAPKILFSDWTSLQGVDGQISSTVDYDQHFQVSITKPNYLGVNYNPKNNKLLTWPYSYLQVSNHAGQVMNYHWENFNLFNPGSTGEYAFQINIALTPGCSMFAFPINYNNILNDFDDSITLGKLPVGSYTTDIYTNWLTQNGVNIVTQLASSTMQVAGGLSLSATGAGATTGASQINSGIIGIANTMGQVMEHSMKPDSLGGNLNCGDVMYTLRLDRLEFKRMTIKNEYAKTIDDFFSMYGYKVNTLKVPNITGRSNWNYVKLINPNIEAYIPQEDLQEIKGMFSDGITLWHTTTNFLDYSQNNSII